MVDFDSALQLHVQGRLPEAEAAYRAIIETDPKNSRVHHVLGRLLHQRGQPEAAIASIKTSLAIRPNDTRALNDVGLLYEEVGAFEAAIDCFTQIITLDPNDATATNNLGVVLKSHNRLPEALAAFTKAVALKPDFGEAFSNMGNTLKRLNDLTGAEAAYRRALEIDPAMLSVYPNLAAVLRRLERLDQATDVFSNWLEHDPDNPIALHLISAGSESQSPPPRATDGYVREVFDEFAESFNEHLARLDYRGPQLIADAMQNIFPASASAVETVLDAGCGTGLCGSILKPIGNRLIGVDLSPKMLDQARQLNVYDELVEADLVEYLKSHPSSFDVVACTDTFGYFGEIEPALTAVRRALTPNGMLICTFETGDDAEFSSGGYRLSKTGRYRHSEAFLRSSLAFARLSIEEWTPSTLRMEADATVPCVVVRARVNP